MGYDPAHDLEGLVEAINAGACDLDLEQIAAAVNERITSGDVTTWWSLTLPDGDVIREEDLTLGDIDDWLRRSTASSWRLLHPLRDPSDAEALLSLHFERQGVVKAEAIRRARAVKPRALLAGYRQEVEAAPTLPGTRAVKSSPSVPGDTDGSLVLPEPNASLTSSTFSDR